MRKEKYDASQYDIRQLVQAYLQCDNLPKLHEKNAFAGRLDEDNDQSTGLHRLFYDGMDSSSAFKDLYDRFVKEVVRPQFDFDIIFQTFPTFRIHQPNNIAVFEYHRDRDYNHNPKEINIFLPMTKAYDSNTFWIESVEGLEDYTPAEATYGEFLIFDGANLRHGNKENVTPDTRVSFDFRVMNIADYDEEHQLSLTSKTKGKRFIIGEYFQSMD
ncbi:MAG: hypothetical protein ACI9TH_002412 [Kiritimatiellia bacterium]|jgi:hypothetical protein